ncbi:hypothetical protein [uncultured Jannaschia sp.]|nr:hypothetical protein [uncultured Jannaschia sp.]
MARIIAALALSALLGGCATYTERTSPCVCNWQPVNVTGEATV